MYHQTTNKIIVTRDGARRTFLGRLLHSWRKQPRRPSSSRAPVLPQLLVEHSEMPSWLNIMHGLVRVGEGGRSNSLVLNNIWLYSHIWLYID